MELYPKKKTDEEYIAFIRDQLGKRKRIIILNAVSFLIFLCVYFAIWRSFTIVKEMDPMFSENADPGFLIGMHFGAIAGLFLMVGVINIFSITTQIKENRARRLMIKFHDRLKEKER